MLKNFVFIVHKNRLTPSHTVDISPDPTITCPTMNSLNLPKKPSNVSPPNWQCYVSALMKRNKNWKIILGYNAEPMISDKWNGIEIPHVKWVQRCCGIGRGNKQTMVESKEPPCEQRSCTLKGSCWPSHQSHPLEQQASNDSQQTEACDHRGNVLVVNDLVVFCNQVTLVRNSDGTLYMANWMTGTITRVTMEWVWIVLQTKWHPSM